MTGNNSQILSTPYHVLGLLYCVAITDFFCALPILAMPSGTLNSS